MLKKENIVKKILKHFILVKIRLYIKKLSFKKASF